MQEMHLSSLLANISAEFWCVMQTKNIQAAWNPSYFFPNSFHHSEDQVTACGISSARYFWARTNGIMFQSLTVVILGRSCTVQCANFITSSITLDTCPVGTLNGKSRNTLLFSTYLSTSHWNSAFSWVHHPGISIFHLWYQSLSLQRQRVRLFDKISCFWCMLTWTPHTASSLSSQGRC